MGLTYGQAVQEWLERAMRKANIASKEVLVEKSGVNRDDVFKAASGEGRPTRTILQRLASFLGTTEPRFELTEGPMSARDWVERAKQALDVASSLMPDPTASATAQETEAFDRVADEVRNDEAGGGEGDQQQPRPA